MRVEPHVDAVGVERVVAFGQDPTRFARFEFRQADRAFGGVFFGAGGLGIVGEDGEGGEDSGVEAAGGDGGGGGGGGGGIEVEDDVGAAAAAEVSAEELAAAGAGEVPAGVEVEGEH